NDDTKCDVSEVVITEDEMVGDVIRMGFIGEAKNTNFIEEAVKMSLKTQSMGVLIHTSEPKLISEEVLVRIGGSHCKVFVKKEIRDIVKFKIKELVGKPMEEDELGENMVNDEEPTEFEPFDDEGDGEDDEEVVDQMAEMGGGHGGAGNDEKEEDDKEDITSVKEFMRNGSDGNGEAQSIMDQEKSCDNLNKDDGRILEE
ncbi:hypothetical protein Tco_0929494, partial [Tanacetum coccineum]